MTAAKPAAHTPGPWRYRPDKYDDWGYVRGPDGGIVAICRAYIRMSEDELNEHRAAKTDPVEADGRLIAAAPDGLVLAHAVAEHFADTDAPLGKMARDFIAKARVPRR